MGTRFLYLVVVALLLLLAQCCYAGTAMDGAGTGTLEEAKHIGKGRGGYRYGYGYVKGGYKYGRGYKRGRGKFRGGYGYGKGGYKYGPGHPHEQNPCSRTITHLMFFFFFFFFFFNHVCMYVCMHVRTCLEI